MAFTGAAIEAVDLVAGKIPIVPDVRNPGQIATRFFEGSAECGITRVYKAAGYSDNRARTSYKSLKKRTVDDASGFFEGIYKFSGFFD